VDPFPLGQVRVQFITYGTRAELEQLLVELVQRSALAPDVDDQIVLAVPDRLRYLLGWPEKQTPHPMAVENALVFGAPRRARAGK